MLTRIFWYHVVGICPVKCQMMRKRTHFSICMLYERYKFCECALDICTSHECTRIEFFSCISVVKITLKCVSANIKVLIHFFPYSLFPLVSLQHFSLTPSVWQQVTVDHVITVFPPCVCVVAVLNSASRETQPRPIYQYRSLFDNIFISQKKHKTYCTHVYHCHLLFFIL